MKIETKIKGIISLVASIVENQISYSCLNLQRIIANVLALLNETISQTGQCLSSPAVTFCMFNVT